WFGTYDGLNRWANGDVTVYHERSAPIAPGSPLLSSRKVHEFTGAGMPGGVQSIFEDSQHRVWLSTAGGVGYLEDDRFVVVNGIPAGLTRAIVEDSAKRLWITQPVVGLFR